MEIKAIRKATKTTQEEMAREVGVSVRTVSWWETSGKAVSDLNNLPQQAVMKFAKKHGVSIN